MMDYRTRWTYRRVQSECYTCKGDVRQCASDLDSVNQMKIEAGPCCSFTGFEAVPWTELFKDLRRGV